MGADTDHFVISGALDAGSHEGRLEEVAAEFMEYMIFAYRGGYTGLVVYEIEPDEPDCDPYAFSFVVDKKSVRAHVGEPETEPSVRIGMSHNTFHRVFFASPSKWELGSLMMRGFIRVSNNNYREVANFASSFDYSRWKEFYSLYRPEKGTAAQPSREEMQQAASRPTVPRLHSVPILTCGRYIPVQLTPAGAVRSSYLAGTGCTLVQPVRDLIQTGGRAHHHSHPYTPTAALKHHIHHTSQSSQEYNRASSSSSIISKQLEVLEQARVAHGFALLQACKEVEVLLVPATSPSTHSERKIEHTVSHTSTPVGFHGQNQHTTADSAASTAATAAVAESAVPTTTSPPTTTTTAGVATTITITRTAPRYLDIHMPHTYAATLTHPQQKLPVRRKRARYTGQGTPPSTGTVHVRTLIGSLPSSVVTPKVVDFAPILERHINYYYTQQENLLLHQHRQHHMHKNKHTQQQKQQSMELLEGAQGTRNPERYRRIQISVVDDYHYVQNWSAAATEYFGFSNSSSSSVESNLHRMSSFYGWLMYWPSSAPAAMGLAVGANGGVGMATAAADNARSQGGMLWSMVSWALPFWR